jgi:four helix bundle protein
MSTIRRFEDILSWQKARELVREIYKIAKTTPLGKDFGLKDQICRAAVSAMTNIAEGFARRTNKEFAHFLDVARGSTIEVQSLLYVTLDVGYITQNDFDRLYKLTNETAALIGGFTTYLRNLHRPQTPNSELRTE